MVFCVFKLPLHVRVNIYEGITFICVKNFLITPRIIKHLNIWWDTTVLYRIHRKTRYSSFLGCLHSMKMRSKLKTTTKLLRIVMISDGRRTCVVLIYSPTIISFSLMYRYPPWCFLWYDVDHGTVPFSVYFLYVLYFFSLPCCSW